MDSLHDELEFLNLGLSIERNTSGLYKRKIIKHKTFLNFQKSKRYLSLQKEFHRTTEKITNQILDKKIFTKEQAYALLNDREKFLYDFFRTFVYLTKVLRQIEFIPGLYIDTLKVLKRTLKRFDSRKSDLFEYHLENYINRIITFKEILARIVNLVYDLKIPEKKCTMDNVLKMINREKEKQLYDILERFNKASMLINKRRNHSLHRGEFSDWYLVQLNSSELMSTLDKSTTSEHKRLEDRIAAGYFYRMLKNYEVLLNYFLIFFDTIYDEIKSKHK
jgi:hypothetical protein